MGEMTPRERAAGLPIWQRPVEPQPLKGGNSNASFTVDDGSGRYVVRIGEDFPFHHVFRATEQATSAAAFSAGLSPELVYRAPGVSVIRLIEAKTFTEADVRAQLPRVLDLVKRCHRHMPQHISGPAPFFWVFHVLRDYGRTLIAANARDAGKIPRLLAIADELEAAQLPLPIVFGHNDLLPTNILDDGQRLWLIDWEYGGFSSPLFDLAGLSSNASFDRPLELAMLDGYLERKPNEAFVRSFDAMKLMAAMREGVWGLVSEVFMNAPGSDYQAYAAEYLGRFERALVAYRQLHG